MLAIVALTADRPGRSPRGFDERDSSLGWLGLGIGIASFVGLSAPVFNLLLFVEMLEAPLVPGLIFLAAPPAIAGTAYFELHGAIPGPFEYGLAGYTVFMLIVWFRLLPALWRAGFTAGFWSLTFPWSAIALFAITWLHVEHPAGESAYAALALGGVTLLIVAIARRSLLAIAHREFLPAVPAIPPETEVLPSGPAPSAAPRSALPAGIFAVRKERRHGA